MTGLERILAAVRFQPTDRLPAVPQVFGHAARLAGVPLVDYLHDGALVARCQLAAQARYGYDAVFAFLDVSVETEAAGSTLRFHPDGYPDVAAYALAPGEDPYGLGLPDPARDGRMPVLLQAVARLREEAGERLLVVGAVIGPMTVATQLMGIEEALFYAADHPEGFARILDYATDVAIRFGTAQLRAGAHLPVVFDPSASPEVVPAAFFREFLLQRFKRLFAALREAGAVANWMNIAGNTVPILPYFPEAGADIVNFDYPVAAGEAQRCLPRTCLNGNIKPLDFTTLAPQQMYRVARALREAFAQRGGFLLSSGCEVPPEAKPENIDAFVAACGDR